MFTTLHCIHMANDNFTQSDALIQVFFSIKLKDIFVV